MARRERDRAGGVLVAAGAAKLWEVYRFEAAIDQLIVAAFGFPGGSIELPRRVLVTLVLGGEVGLGCANLLLAGRSRTPALAAGVLFLGFALLQVWLLGIENPPTCGCFGAGGSWLLGDGPSWFAVVRNLGLAALGGCAAFDGVRLGRRGMARASGFTLPELLVVVGVIVLVIALSVPALLGARATARRAAALASLRDGSVAIGQYAVQSTDFLPFMGVPHHPELGVLQECDADDFDTLRSYFRGNSTYWPTALWRAGLDLSTQPSIARDSCSQLYSFSWLTHAAAARPGYWEGADPPNEARLFAGGRTDEVVFPAAKGLLCDVGSLTDRDRAWGVAAADGSVEMRSTVSPSQYVPGLVRRFGAVPWRVLTTPRGLRGRDY